MQWKQHPDIERIEVSDEGQVRNSLTKHVYIQHVNRGYKRVTLSIKGKNKHFRVHRLVSQVFIKNPDNLPQVNHINGNKLDNNVTNLEWVTAKDNMRHAYFIGLRYEGLTNEQKDFIREHYKPRDSKYGGRPLAKLFNVSEKVVYRFVHNHMYRIY